MNTVYLIYEDDYGGMFSPYILTKVCKTEEEAKRYIEGKGWLARIVPYGEREDGKYPEYNGGKF
jgi:hypothetical protein